MPRGIAQDTESESEQFRAILDLAGLGPLTLAELGEGRDYRDTDWQLLLQVFGRLQQFGDEGASAPVLTGLSPWSPQEALHRLGEIVHIAGVVEAVEEVALPARIARLFDRQFVYRCQLRFPADVSTGVSADTSTGVSTGEPAYHEGKKTVESKRGEGKSEDSRRDVATLLTTRVPNGWRDRKVLNESVQVRGAIVQWSAERQVPLILTHHLAWFPTDGVPTGQQLLARYGMDVALLDEVRHRQPFVPPETSREGEAFYAALDALEQVDAQEIARLARINIASKAATWRAAQPELASKHRELKAKLASEIDVAQRQRTEREVQSAREQLGLAAAVVQLSEEQRSSVAPLFLQPQQEVGELVSFAGIARRAVRISVADRPHAEQPNLARPTPHLARPDIDAYYEMEIFTADSQNLPIVCCLLQLPTGFPTGDEIREPVRIDGIFFKNWRFRSRKLEGTAGETGRQRQLYTPVLLGKLPTWLKQTASPNNRWALWGGIGFLVLLVLLWMSMTWLARQDRIARGTLRHHEIIDL